MGNRLKGNGAAVNFLRVLAGYNGKCCVTWPFKRLPNGYGQFGYLGQHLYAHRFMCELEHGPAPSEDHIVAHDCGKGHLGCVNPRHLMWKTRTANELDKRTHGTTQNAWWGYRGKLKPEQVSEIRLLKGQKTQAEIAAMFNISEPTIRDIFLGRSHRADRKLHCFTEQEDGEIALAIGRDDPFPDIAARLGRSPESIRARAYRIGLLGRPTTNGQTAND